MCLSAETQIQHGENGCHSCSPTGNLPRSHLQTSPRRNKKNLPSKRNGHFGFHGWIRLAIYQRPVCRHSPSRRGRQGRRPCKAPLQCGPNQNLAESPFLLTGLYPESHGIVSNKFWDPVYQEKFIYDYDCSDSDPKFYNASEPIWLTLQKQGGRSGIYFWPGSRGYPEKPIFYEKPFCKVRNTVTKRVRRG